MPPFIRHLLLLPLFLGCHRSAAGNVPLSCFRDVVDHDESLLFTFIHFFGCLGSPCFGSVRRVLPRRYQIWTFFLRFPSITSRSFCIYIGSVFLFSGETRVVCVRVIRYSRLLTREERNAKTKHPSHSRAASADASEADFEVRKPLSDRVGRI